MPVTGGEGIALRIWDDPVADDIPEKLEDFLRKLGGPTIIRCRGRESGRRRIVSTLMHGNEPSSVMAIHQLLRNGVEPRVDVDYLVLCVNTALSEPLFSHRYLPHLRDMNRCFRAPFEGPQGKFAETVIAYLRSANAEAVVDVHNTSGNGPAFSLCTRDLDRGYDIASLFTERLIFTHIQIGSLMEVEVAGCPVVTIECGGCTDPRAHEVALRGLERFISCDQLFYREHKPQMDLYYHPVRMELAEHASIQYADQQLRSVDITLPSHIDRLNFGAVTPETPLAWVGESGLDYFRIADEKGRNVAQDYFRVVGSQVFPVEPLKLFMVTTNPLIARTDCILYAVKEKDHRAFFS